jgi:hypothetical protein
MKHVPKQEWMGCAVATVGMCADLSYDEVAAALVDRDQLAGTRLPDELRRMLTSLTATEWQIKRSWVL